MGLTQIRYIDLKNYLDEILETEEMRLLFNNMRRLGTIYINDPANFQKTYAYLYAIQEWSQASLHNLSVSVDYYTGYKFRINVYDGSGTVLYDSYYPSVKIIQYNETTGLYGLVRVNLLPSYPNIEFQKTATVYKLDVNADFVPFLGLENLKILFSNITRNQSGTPESIMSIASLLVDSANTRTFGIPTYGFSARTNFSGFGGITYNCAQYININTTPDQDGETTLIESIFFRLSLEEDTYYVGLDMIEPLPDPQKMELLSLYVNRDMEMFNSLLSTFLQAQKEHDIILAKEN
jgi:hypothetical protein